MEKAVDAVEWNGRIHLSVRTKRISNFHGGLLASDTLNQSGLTVAGDNEQSIDQMAVHKNLESVVEQRALCLQAKYHELAMRYVESFRQRDPHLATLQRNAVQNDNVGLLEVDQNRTVHHRYQEVEVDA